MTEQFYSEATTFTSSAGVAVQRALGYIQNYCPIPIRMLSNPNFSRHLFKSTEISYETSAWFVSGVQVVWEIHTYTSTNFPSCCSLWLWRDSITLCKVIYELALIHERKLHCNSSYSSLGRKKASSQREEEKEAERQKEKKERVREREREEEKQKVKQRNESSLWLHAVTNRKRRNI